MIEISVWVFLFAGIIAYVPTGQTYAPFVPKFKYEQKISVLSAFYGSGTCLVNTYKRVDNELRYTCMCTFSDKQYYLTLSEKQLLKGEANEQ